MLVSPIKSNSYTPSSRALYFTKTPTVMLDASAKFMEHENVSVSRKGFRYLKDTNIAEELRERFATNPLVKDLARQYETFIWFVETKTAEKGYSAVAKIMHVLDNGEMAKTYIKGHSEYTQNLAREKMFRAMSKGEVSVN